jgi:hypothetical protein
MPLTTGVSGSAFAGPDPVTSMAATAGPAQHANSIILAPNRIILSSVGEALFYTVRYLSELLLAVLPWLYSVIFRSFPAERM